MAWEIRTQRHKNPSVHRAGKHGLHPAVAVQGRRGHAQVVQPDGERIGRRAIGSAGGGINLSDVRCADEIEWVALAALRAAFRTRSGIRGTSAFSTCWGRVAPSAESVLA